MHGVKRQRISQDAQDAKRREEAEQIASFQSMSKECLNKRDAKDYSPSSFTLTTNLLNIHPEFYSIWTYRRRILLSTYSPSSLSSKTPTIANQDDITNPEGFYNALKGELRLTLGMLREVPKSYWVWGHRRWVLENIPFGPGGMDKGKEGKGDSKDKDGNQEGWRNETWGKELMMTEKMLEADARNFHAWDYLRYVLASLPPTFSRTPPTFTLSPTSSPSSSSPSATSTTPTSTRPILPELQSQLRYTTKKIEQNFSNFSAWHMRGKVLEGMWEQMGEGYEVGGEGRRKVLSEEFDLVTQALWVDPKDQSGWLYHRWLIGDGKDTQRLRKEIEMIKELLEAEPGAKWPLESLSHYSLILARQPSTSEDARASLIKEVKNWLKTLEEIDPFRKERYRELAASCDS